MDNYSASLQAIGRNFDLLARSAERVSRTADHRVSRRAEATDESRTAAANQRLASQNEPASQSVKSEQTVDLAAEVVEQLNVRRSTEAQINVLRSQDEMLGLILDLKA